MKILDDLISILNPEAGVKDIRQGRRASRGRVAASPQLRVSTPV